MQLPPSLGALAVLASLSTARGASSIALDAVGEAGFDASIGGLRRPGGRRLNNGNGPNNGLAKGRVASHDCTVQVAALLYDGDPAAMPADFDEEEFDCEMDRLDTASPGNSGSANNAKGPPATRTLQLTPQQKAELKEMWNSGELVANESKLKLKEMKSNGKGVEWDDEGLKVPPGLAMKDLISNPPAVASIEEERPAKEAADELDEPAMRIDERTEEVRARDRRLVDPYNGDYGTRVGVTPFLVVKVKDKNGKAVTLSPAELACNVFGQLPGEPACDDVDNLKSVLESCSMGKMSVQPGVSDHESKYSAKGVLEVTIPLDITTATNRNQVHDAVTAAVEAKGIPLPGQYKHVLYMLENCYGSDCAWMAYAYFNKWMSVYKGGPSNKGMDRNIRSSPVAVHELGHNFNLHHSGEDTAQYKDHTGAMGNPWFDDDKTMCYNAAKSWQIGWYNDRKVIVNPTTKSTNWSTTLKLVGIADYDTPEATSIPVVLKLETGTATDYYVGLNRKKGVHADTKKYENLVVVYKTGADGEDRSISWIQGALADGQSVKLTDGFGGTDVHVKVLQINTSAEPWTATIAVGRDRVPQSAAAQSCGADTVPVRIDIIADKYPQDISWTLTNDCTGTVEASRNSFPDGSFGYSDDYCLPPAGYTFRIDDSYGDGLAKGYDEGSINGRGSYTVTYDGSVVATGGSYTTSETATFGACAATPDPTKAPTNEPTPLPTKKPTDSPSKSPTAAPSVSPSRSPTQQPTTPNPTEAEATAPPSVSPTTSPTKKPSTASPTASPSKSPTEAEATAPPSVSPTPSPTKKPSTASPTASPSRAPTDAPSKPPTDAPTKEINCVNVDLRLVMDAYPEDVSWTLTNSATGGVVGSGPDGETYEKNLDYSYSYCVPPGDAYVFEIVDSYGDGMCCKYGEGSYTIAYDGEAIVSGGAHKGGATVVIGPGGSVAPAMANLEDTKLSAPKCSFAGSGCSSSDLLRGRGDVGPDGGPENNAPNTLDGCREGVIGAYQKDESIEKISVLPVGGPLLRKGQSATIAVDVWAYNDKDVAEFWTKTALSNAWELVGRASATVKGTQTLISPEFTLSGSTLQAVRVQFGYRIPEGNTNLCRDYESGDGRWDDRDDLVFFVAA